MEVKNGQSAQIECLDLGCLHDGKKVTGYRMSLCNGMSVLISDYGGAIWQLWTPGRNGELADVVCGYDCASDMENSDGYVGALIGRWGNRIAKGHFTMDGTEYQLFSNDGSNHLHGGKIGFDRHFWQVIPTSGKQPSLQLSRLSPDGEEGYPGNLQIKVTYSLREVADGRGGELVLRYEALTDKKTVLNLTNHAYFNLGGYDSGTVLDHVLQLDAVDYLETDRELIPTGRRIPVIGTPFDFTAPKALRAQFWPDYRCPDMQIAGGYDHCLNFRDRKTGNTVVCRGFLWEPNSGRKMEIWTNQPCVQLYTANFFKDNGICLKNGVHRLPQGAVCLETQRMPDSMNHMADNFTSPYLLPGEKYDYTTVYRFYAE